jgi:sec-independent protein translocase protein TatC
VALVFVAASIAAYIARAPIMQQLLAPLAGEKLVYISPFGGIQFLLKVCAMVGALIALPVLFVQLLGFVVPAVATKHAKLARNVLCASAILALAGATFALFVALPASLQFLNSFGDEYVTSMIATNEYISFVVVYLLGFAVSFQLPLLMIVINRFNRLDPPALLGALRYVIVVSFIVGAILTPTPDPINQAIMAGPIIVLYPIGCLAVLLINRKNYEVTTRALPKGGTKRVGGNPMARAIQSHATQPIIPAYHHNQPLRPLMAASGRKQLSIDGFIR